MMVHDGEGPTGSLAVRVLKLFRQACVIISNYVRRLFKVRRVIESDQKELKNKQRKNVHDAFTVGKPVSVINMFQHI